MAKKKPKKASKGPTPKLRDAADRTKFLGKLRQYPSLSAACSAIGITRRTLYNEMQRDADFAEEVRKADQEGRGKIEHAMYQTAVEGKDVQALKFILERKYWRMWGRRDPESFKFKDIVKWANGLGEALAQRLPVEHQATAMSVIFEQLEQFGENHGTT